MGENYAVFLCHRLYNIKKTWLFLDIEIGHVVSKGSNCFLEDCACVRDTSVHIHTYIGFHRCL
jgi:hypothetical protein